jgi:hypothetical protein
MHIKHGKHYPIIVPDSVNHLRDILNQCRKISLLNHQKPIIMNQFISLGEFILIILICYPLVIFGKTLVEHIKEK